MLTHADLPRLIELGVEIGNHTATHVHCGALSADEYQSELVDPQSRARSAGGKPGQIVQCAVRP
jgi:peptidoglycan/xylan/chitin deacetylase (PgdA/CDA1 family)